MNLVHAVIAVAAFTAISRAGSPTDEPTFRPLDTRTRCIVLFCEALVLIAKKDVDGILANIADGGAPGTFRLYPDRVSLSPDLKREIQDVDQFLKHNFLHSESLHRKFNEILFSDLQTAKETVTVKDMAAAKEHKAQLHVINVKLQDIDDRRFSELRFVEVDGRLYWVPFGW